MFVFVVSSMLAVGLSLTVGQIVAPLRNGKLVALALLGNFVLMPLGAFVVARLLWLDESLRVALLLLSTAAGAPFLPMLAGIAKGNLAFAVGLMVLLMILTVGYMPLALPLLLEGVAVDPTKIARSLVLLMLLPLALGLGVKALYALAAARVRPFLDRVSSLSLALLTILIVAVNINNLVALFGTRGILASILFLCVGVSIGWFLGGPNPDTRGVMALGTAQRNIAAALVVGGQNFDDPKVIVMVVVVAIVGLLVLFLLLAHFDSLEGISLSLFPVAAGVIAMLGLMALFGMKLNFMNAMVLVTIIGMGSDYGLHIANRVRTRTGEEGRAAFVQAGRAIFLSALTTIAGFGSLAFTDYGALASIGWATNYGVGATALFALLSLPAFMAMFRNKGTPAA
jgi:BASS family bile acid:Na+ symporter